MKRLITTIAILVAGPAWAGQTQDAARALAASRAHLESRVLRSLGAGAELRAKSHVVLDSLGQGHVRYQQFHHGIPVFEGEAIAHVDLAGGSVLGVTDALTKVTVPDIKPSLERSAAQRLALQTLGVGSARTSTELAVLPTEDGGRLAWRVHATRESADLGPLDWVTFLDAHTGEVLKSYDNLHTLNGHGYYSGDVALTTQPAGKTHELRDPTRGGHYTLDMRNFFEGAGILFTDRKNDWGDGTLSDRQSIGVDAQYGAVATWDYFALEHGRNGIADDGRGGYSRAHFGFGYTNAFWSDECFCMTYGDGDNRDFSPLVSLDVAGHEMTHGVTSHTANLTYAGESGGLNEATSDIFGTAVEFHAANPNDPPDYLIGENVTLSGQPLRYMYKPSLDQFSPDCYSPVIAFLDVHLSSGIANRFFYFLSEGTTALSGPGCNGEAFPGIGRTNAEQIWYRALTTKMTAGTDYSAARVATIEAAGDLYGEGSAEQTAVATAWTAVRVE